jgi:hypothetical protein
MTQAAWLWSSPTRKTTKKWKKRPVRGVHFITDDNTVHIIRETSPRTWDVLMVINQGIMLVDWPRPHIHDTNLICKFVPPRRSGSGISFLRSRDACAVKNSFLFLSVVQQCYQMAYSSTFNTKKKLPHTRSSSINVLIIWYHVLGDTYKPNYIGPSLLVKNKSILRHINFSI